MTKNDVEEGVGHHSVNGRYNEDLFQYLMIHVTLKIHKFNP